MAPAVCCAAAAGDGEISQDRLTPICSVLAMFHVESVPVTMPVPMPVAALPMETAPAVMRRSGRLDGERRIAGVADDQRDPLGSTSKPRPETVAVPLEPRATPSVDDAGRAMVPAF